MENNDYRNAIINVVTDHSVRQSVITIDRLVGYVKNNGVSHIIVSDYNTLSGTADLIKKRKQSNIKVSVGVKIQLLHNGYTGYITLIAKNHAGYIALCKILRDGYNNQIRGLPIIDLDVLKMHCGYGTSGYYNIIITTCGLDGLFFDLIKECQSEAMVLLRSLVDIFDEKNVFVEVQYHGYSSEQQHYPVMANMAELVGVGLLATNDPRYIYCSDEEVTAYNVVKYAQNKRAVPITAADNEYYIKPPDKLREALSCILYDDQVDNSINNIAVLAEACDLKFPNQLHYPKYKNDDGRPSAEILREMVRKNIPKKYKQWTEQHEARLNHELDVIISMGYEDYMLIVADYVSFARTKGKEKFQNDNAVVVGPGRGSAVGSIVCYLLSITDVDPISNGLLFERFLNRARTSMPDIDVDFAKCIKDDVIDYVKQKYGYNAICKISVSNKYSARGAISLCSEYLEKKNKDQSYLFIGNAITEFLKKEGKDTKYGISDHVDELLSVVQGIDKEKASQIIKAAIMIENAISYKSVHPSGVIIADTDIADCVPIKIEQDGDLIAECDKDEAEGFYHLLKMDFLTLTALDLISYTIRSISAKEHISVSFERITYEKEVFENIISKGHTDFIFQLSKPDMKQVLRSIKPRSIDELMLVLSVSRPGPKQYIDLICKIKNGEENPKYLLPELEPILKETYGCIVFQEQVMRIFTDLAGYSTGEADVVRSAIAKKKKIVIVAEHDKFLQGCENNGIDKEKANALYDQIVNFGEYCFNKSHASAYAIIAYRMAWLYYHYPQYFLCYAPFFFDNETSIFFEECIRNRIKIVSPSVNKSKNKNRVVREGILLGYSMISGIGSFGEVIERNRYEQGKYIDLVDFILRINPTDFVIKTLALSGAFDCLGIDRQSVADNSLDIIRIGKTIKCFIEKLKYTQDGYERTRIEHEIAECKAQITKLSTGNNNPDIAARIKIEVEVFGFPVSLGGEWLDSARNNQVITSICNLTLGYHTLCGVVYNVDILKTLGKKEEYAKIKIYDGTGVIECTVSSRYYPQFKDVIIKGFIVNVTGNYTYDEDRNQYTFWVNDITLFRL